MRIDLKEAGGKTYRYFIYKNCKGKIEEVDIYALLLELRSRII